MTELMRHRLLFALVPAMLVCLDSGDAQAAKAIAASLFWQVGDGYLAEMASFDLRCLVEDRLQGMICQEGPSRPISIWPAAQKARLSASGNGVGAFR